MGAVEGRSLTKGAWNIACGIVDEIFCRNFFSSERFQVFQIQILFTKIFQNIFFERSIRTKLVRFITSFLLELRRLCNSQDSVSFYSAYVIDMILPVNKEQNSIKFQ